VLRLAAQVGARLTARKETVAVAESSAGGLISAALLAVPGASAYFRGGGVVYTLDAKSRLLGEPREAMSPGTGPLPDVPYVGTSGHSPARAATEAHALILARAARKQLDATWGIGETGASGPTGNRYGDPPGHACVGVAGGDAAGRRERALTVATGHGERLTNMYAFAWAALELLASQLG